jgi:polyhydroxyalkanoate synthesis regulator phasin
MNLFQFAEDEARRQGIDPALVRRVVNQESGGRTDAVSPKGARGPMQLMPGTARELGVNPADPLDNIRGGVKYLKKQLDTFGTPELALAAYNAGPGAVRRAGGVPQYRETQNYVRSVMGGAKPQSGADIFGMGEASAGPSAAGPQSGADIFADAPAPPRVATPAPVQAPQAPQRPTVAQDAVSGFTQPFRDFGHNVAEDYRAFPGRKPPANPAEFVTSIGRDLGRTTSMVTGALNLASAPVQAFTRPAARAGGTHLPDAYQAPQLKFDGLRPYLTDPRKLSGDEKQALNEGILNTALSTVRAPVGDLAATRAAIPATPAVGGRNLTQQVRAVTPQMPGRGVRTPTMTLDQLKRADDALWQKVDASGYRFPQPDVQAAATDARKMLHDAGPTLYPEAARVVDRIEELAKAGNLTPAQANRLRSQIGEKLLQPGSTEASLGADIKKRIDALIDTANDPNLAAAREMHTRYKKVEEVTKRTDSADLRASSTYAGGNKANATRQNLRPLIDPKSNQRLRNLTADETKALNRVVRGTPGANAARVTGKVLDPRGLLGASVQTLMGIPTGGHSALAMIPGMAASELSNTLTLKSVQDLIDLISVGGKKPPTAPIGPRARGLIGAGATVAPLARSAGVDPKKRSR